jgi:hypothetical protein
MNDELAKEVIDRGRRMETKLTKILVAIGITEMTTMPISSTASTTFKPAEVELAGYDITLTRIKQILRSAADIDVCEPITIMVKGRKIAKLTFLED